MLIYQYLQPLGFFLLLIGLALCFFGFELYKAYIRITGFFIGAAIGLILAIFFRGGLETSLILALVFGVLGVIFAIPLTFLFLFLEGGINGALITLGILFIFNNSLSNSMGIVAVSFIIAGVLAVAFKIGFTIISTSVAGAIGITIGVLLLFPRILMYQSPIFIIFMICLISIVGMVVQFGRLDNQTKTAVSKPSLKKANIVPAKPSNEASYPGIVCPNCKNNNAFGSIYCGTCGYLLTSSQLK